MPYPWLKVNLKTVEKAQLNVFKTARRQSEWYLRWDIDMGLEESREAMRQQ